MDDRLHVGVYQRFGRQGELDGGGVAHGIAIVSKQANILVHDVNEIASADIAQESLRIAPASGDLAILGLQVLCRWIGSSDKRRTTFLAVWWKGAHNLIEGIFD